MDNRYETFTVLLNRISRNIRKIKNQEMAQYGLRSAHISCLYYLNSEGGLTATALCERCEEDKATISRAVDYLEKNGYLTCDSQNTKRYKSPLYLTEKGRQAGAEIAEKIDRVLAEISGGLSDVERSAFYRSLSIISKSLDWIAKKSGKKGY
jgi:DNA-binding MarR family transcriptional regulator